MGWSPSNDRRKWVATLDLVDCSRAVKFMLTVRRKTDFQLLRELIWTCWASIDSTLSLIALWLLVIMINGT